MRLMSCLVVVFLLTVPAFAQSAAGWCEVAEPAEPILPEPLTIAEDFPQIAPLVPLPPNSHYTLWTEGEINFSADHQRGLISISDTDTWKPELIGLNLEDNSIYFRLPYSVIETLRPPTTEDYYTGVQFRLVEWMGNSHRIALQTLYICQFCGEDEPIPDDLYMIDEQGELKTLLKGEPSVEMSISPDGNFVLFSDRQTISLLDVRDGSRRDSLIPNYNGDIPPYGSPRLYNLWEETHSALVISHQGDYNDLTAPIDVWRVFTDGRPSELLRQFDGLFDDKLRFDLSQRYLGYLWLRDDERNNYDLMVQELATGDTWDLAQEYAYQDISWNWTSAPATIAYNDRTLNPPQPHFFAPCQ